MSRKSGFASREQQAAAMSRLKSGSTKTRPSRPLSRHAGKKPNDVLPRVGINTLRAILMARGSQAFFNDITQSHDRTGPVTDQTVVRTWLRDSGRADVQGVDTPGSEYPSPKSRQNNTSFNLNPLHGELFSVEIEGSTRRHITPDLQERREQQIDALQKTRDMLKSDLEKLEEQGQKHNGPPLSDEAKKELRRRLHEGRRVLANAEAQLGAFQSGKLLIIGKIRDRKLIEQYAELIKDAFELDPRSMDLAAIYVGTTQVKEATGYTHPIKSPGKHPVTVPFVAINNRYYDLEKPLKDPESRRRRLTMIHETIHVLRGHESGRTTKETQHISDYGKDRDREEAHTVLETQLHSGRFGNRRDESYYAFIPDVPEEVGAEDNRRIRATRSARRIKHLPRINEAMKNADKAHISRLRNKRGKWGAARNPENVDRVFKTSDGDVIHVHNPTGFDVGDVEAFVDGLDGDKGDRVREYHDGRLGRVAKNKAALKRGPGEGSR